MVEFEGPRVAGTGGDRRGGIAERPDLRLQVGGGDIPRERVRDLGPDGELERALGGRVRERDAYVRNAGAGLWIDRGDCRRSPLLEGDVLDQQRVRASTLGELDLPSRRGRQRGQGNGAHVLERLERALHLADARVV